ncbi:site-specific DNA-methyltransferase [Caulobacter segnis]|uniref:Methyltransferase n=1 Tax=Caulobacter segnis TaxID=88688 RepID=A0A2W5VIF4_9CAUL|nr:site-specific DNA-methyltransferase [Caulobacter segnis]PZR36476.1 MAG: site-specific DNA-methyltransferase [Caulobacter segnis]
MVNVFDQHVTERFGAYHVDAVEFVANMPSNSIDFSVYSPPFSSLYIYSESARDMGNVSGDEEFRETYEHLLRELWRVTKPGRLTCIHVKDLVYYSNASEDGSRGLRDFSGDCIAAHEAAGAEAARIANVVGGWAYHRRVTVDRCPVREMQKTKADRLLYKHFREDAARTGGGLPEYMIWFRKWAPGMEDVDPVVHRPEEFPLDTWQEWAQPIWRGLTETDVLNVKVARDDGAEKHLCPMPLNLTERAIRQYTNPGDTVFSPFMGIGSEGYVALRAGRRFVGTELKDSYFRTAVKNLREMEVESSAPSLLGAA